MGAPAQVAAPSSPLPAAAVVAKGSAAAAPTHGSQAIEEASLLLYFAASRGIDIAPEVGTAVIRFRAATAPEVESELEFWRAYSALAGAIRPATLLSVRAATLKETHGGRLRTRAEWAVARYRLYAIIAILIVVIVQAYWVYGVQIVETLQKKEAEAQELKLKMAERKSEIERALGPNDEPDLPSDAKYGELAADWKARRYAAQASSAELRDWVTFATRFIPFKSDLEGAVPDESGSKEGPVDDQLKEENRVRALARFIPVTLQSYLLPLFYGLLGSAVYILRSLAGEIQKVSFESDVGYRLRLPLGALAGAALSWFFGEAFSGATGFKSLSPFALAFLGGYSVEVLFSGMDRLVEAFGGTASSSTGRKSAEGS